MATKKKPSAGKKPLALTLLERDHKTVSAMFKRYEKLGDGADKEKRSLIREICHALTAHATLEEEIFYPELRAALQGEGEDTMNEATVEHASIKDLVTQLENVEPDDDLVDAKVCVLSEYVNHHVEEEEGEMFKLARRAKKLLDLQALGERMAERKEQLESEVAPTARRRPTNQGRVQVEGIAAKGAP